MKKESILYQSLALLGAALIIVVYFLPIWWVALQSRQYPKAMYPKGIRIEFFFDGVFNGCEGVKERAEIRTNEGAECLVEMNAINHFIGMYPIVQGVNTNANMNPKGEEKKIHPEYYVFDTQKDQDGNEIIDPETGTAIEIDVTPGYLKFLDGILKNAKYIFGVFVIMLLIFAFTPKRKFNFLAIIPSLIPFYFLGLFAYSLYWYGHHLDLHGGGAFSGIKPFMPTVFGHGKVAQFETIAFPYFGFFVAIIAFLLIIFAVLKKRKFIRSAQNIEQTQ